jgi:ferrous iron transport protein A
MKLSELTKNQKAIIVKIDCDMELKQRFYSFGITKNSEIVVNNTSLAKNTIEIVVEDTSIALRMNEANTIEVELV